MKNNNLWVTIGLVGLILIGLIVWSLSAAGNDDDTKRPSGREQGTAATEQSETERDDSDATIGAIITYRENGFSETSYTVKAGNTVKLVNNSSRTLEFSSDDHPTHLKNPELNLPPLASGETTTFTPTKAGTWRIHDHNSADMTATIFVND